MVGFTVGNICEPVLIGICFFQLRFQVRLLHMFSNIKTSIVDNLLIGVLLQFCRHRAFSFLFADGENEELNSLQTVDSHCFPQHFEESKENVGLAPAAIVVSRRESYGSSSALKSLDYNKQIRPYYPAIG